MRQLAQLNERHAPDTLPVTVQGGRPQRPPRLHCLSTIYAKRDTNHRTTRKNVTEIQLAGMHPRIAYY